MIRKQFLILLLCLIVACLFLIQGREKTMAVNVTNYGAIGDGKTDDTNAIISALNAVSHGGTLIIPTGTYLIKGIPASMPALNNVLIDGEGDPTLKFTGPTTYSSTAIWTHLSHVTFQHITFSAPYTNIGTVFGSMANISYLTFYDCTVIDTCGHFLSGATNDVRFDNCRFLQSSNPPAIIQQDIGQVVRNFYVIGCEFEYQPNGQAGALISAATNKSGLLGNYWFMNNRFLADGNGFHTDAAIDIEPSGITPLSNVYILNNVCWNARFYMTGADNIICTGNRMHWTYGSSSDATVFDIYNSSPTHPTGNRLLIEGNYVTQANDSTATYSGIPIKIVTGINNITILNDYIQVNGANGGSIPLEYLSGAVKVLTITDNTFDQTAAVPNKSLWNISGTDLGHIKIKGNTVKGQWQHYLAGNGLSSGNLKSVVVEQNDFQDASTSTGSNFHIPVQIKNIAYDFSDNIF